MAFCKIIELPETQVLIRKDIDEQESKPSLVIHIETQSMYFNTTLTYENEEKRNKSFKSFNEKHAEAFYNHLKQWEHENNSN